MDVELVLGSIDGGVYDQRHRVAVRQPPSAADKQRPRAPGGIEIVWSVGCPQEWILDTHDLARRREDHVMHQWRAEHDIATLFAAGEVNRQARIGSGGEGEISDAGPDHLPQRLPLEAKRKGRNGGHRYQARGGKQ